MVREVLMEVTTLEYVPELHYDLDSVDDETNTVAKLRTSEYAKKEDEAIKSLIDYLHEDLSEVTKQFDVVFYKLPLHKETPAPLSKGSSYQKVFKVCGNGEVGPSYIVSKCYGIPDILSTKQSYNQCVLFDRLHPTRAHYVFSFKKELDYTGLLKVEKLSTSLDHHEIMWLDSYVVYSRNSNDHILKNRPRSLKNLNNKYLTRNEKLVRIEFKPSPLNIEKSYDPIKAIDECKDNGRNILNVLMSQTF